MNRADIAIAIKIDERFFYGFGKSGRVITAWSLAGAKLFGYWHDEDICHIEKRLEAKGKKHHRILVAVQDGDVQIMEVGNNEE